MLHEYIKQIAEKEVNKVIMGQPDRFRELIIRTSTFRIIKMKDTFFQYKFK